MGSAGAGDEGTSQMDGEEDNINDDESSQYIISFGDGDDFGSPPSPVPPSGGMGESVQESSSVPEPGGSSSSTLDSLQYLITEATRFSTEIKRLTGELNVANQRIEEQDFELLQCKTQMSEQSQLIEEQQRRIDVLETEKQNLENFGGGGEGGGEGVSILDIRELKSMVAKERQNRVQAEDKLEKLKKSMKSVVCEELNGFVQDLKKNFGGDMNSDDLGGNGEKAQDRLDRLSKFVEEKFGTWAENQISLKADLGNMSKLVLNLSTILNSTSTTANVKTLAPPPPSRRSMRAASTTRNDNLQQEQEGPAMPVLIKQNEMSNRKRSRSTPPRRVPSTSSTPPPKRFGSTAASPGGRLTNANLDHGEDLSRESRGFFCICGTDYSTRSNLRIHVQTYTEVGKFKCDICKQHFVLYYMLKRHLKDKHNITPTKGTVGCANCGKVFSSFVTLYEHRKIAHTRISVMDQNASSDFNNENMYEDENDDIDDCEIIDPDHANPVPNGNKQRDPPIKKSGPLSTVARKYASIVRTTPADFFAARRNSNQAFSKSEASEEDDDYENYERKHVSYSGKKHGMNIARRHQGFYCICGIKFITRKRLDGHVQFENKKMGVGRKSYLEEEEEEDDEGDAEYDEVPEEEEGAGTEGGADYNPIQEQEHRVHPTDEQSCICGFQTTIKYNLTKHIKYNTMERKFSCQTCPLTFVNLSYLRRHYLRTHKDIAMYNEMKSKSGCSKCGKTFRSMLEIQRHRRIVHGVKTPFPSTRKILQRSVGGRSAYIRNPNGQFGGTRRSFQVQRQDQESMGNNQDHGTQESGLVSSRKFQCSVCLAPYATFHQLSRHKKAKHNIIQKGFAIGCVDCGITFSSRREHTRHRITVHQSAIGRKRLIKSEIGSPPIKTEMKKVPTSQISPQPEAIPISMNDEDYDDQQQPSTSRGHQNATNYNSDDFHRVDTSRTVGNFCICGAHFNEKKNLHSHIRRNTESWNFECKICHKPFFYHAAMKRHMLYTHKIQNVYTSNKTVGCVICGATFQSWSLLRQHTASHRGKDDERAGGASASKRPCYSPRKTTPAKARRTYKKRPQTPQVNDAPRVTHGVDVAMANRGHYCLCGKNCNSERALIVHIKYNSRERNLPCNYCDRRFICPSYLKQHTERSHKNVVGVVSSKLNRCRKCGKTFRTNVELYRHNKTAHKPTKIGHGTRNPRKTTYHTATAADEIRDGDIHEVADLGTVSGTPRCSCGKEYLTKSGLQKHIRTQAEGQVFKCHLCPKKYVAHGSLKIHLRKSHRIRYQKGVHACGVCAQVFSGHGDVIKHRVRVHGRRR